MGTITVTDTKQETVTFKPDDVRRVSITRLPSGRVTVTVFTSSNAQRAGYRKRYGFYDLAGRDVLAWYTGF